MVDNDEARAKWSRRGLLGAVTMTAAAASYARQQTSEDSSTSSGHVFNVREHGATGDGDDVTPIVGDFVNTLSVATRTSSNHPDTPVIYFPSGRYRIDAGILTFANSVAIRGDGWGNTFLELNRSTSGELVDLSGSQSTIADINLSGRAESQDREVDLIAVNASYCRVENVYLNAASGSGIVIGRSGRAIVSQFSNIVIRNSRQYGIHVVANSSFPSTDMIFQGIDIGNSGRNGVLLRCGGQTISDLHVWGSGIDSRTEIDGVFVSGGNCQFSNLQCESNQGSGLRIDGDVVGICVTSGKLWGNGRNGAHLSDGASRCMLELLCFDNGLSGEESSVGELDSSTTAGIHLENALRNSVRVVAYDTGKAVLSGKRLYDDGRPYDPSNPFVGREATRTQSYAVVESGVSDFNQYFGQAPGACHTRGAVRLLGKHANVASLQCD